MNRPKLLPGLSSSHLICIILAAAFIGGCGQEAVEPVERIRAVKTIIVADLASAQKRKFPGTIEPVDSSQLSFEVDGIVKVVQVDIGDRFKKGDLLASLDNQPFLLSVASAKASLARATAQFEEKRSAFERERRIQKEDAGATTQKAVDQARAAYESHVQEVSYSEARLGLTEQELAYTELRAPYDGIVSGRFVEPSEVAARGAQVLETYAEGGMQVAVSIPEQIVGNVHVGLKGHVFLNNQPDHPYDAIISEVGSAAITANAFPVKAAINKLDERLRPGMTAELRLEFHGQELASAYLIPVHAFLPGLEKNDYQVYLLDTTSSTVRKTPVKIRSIQGDKAVVTEGLSPGDILVVAGVPFLRDGQQVENMPASDSTQR